MFWPMPWAQCRSNKGAPGVDGQDFADVEAYGVQRWLRLRGASSMVSVSSAVSSNVRLPALTVRAIPHTRRMVEHHSRAGPCGPSLR